MKSKLLTCFGTLTLLLVSSVRSPLQAQVPTFSVLYSFTNGADGGQPFSSLASDAAGNLYGTTSAGGSHLQGTVFKVDTSGKETVLHSFNYTDGASPYAGVIRDALGNLYGATYGGGISGYGTVFKLSPSGNLAVLHKFTGGADGGHPYFENLLRDAGGNLYGTTSGDNGATSYGTLFEVSPNGTETVLHSFSGKGDGSLPYAGLIRDPAGNLYGTTALGGNPCDQFGCGTVFKLNTAGKETVLFKFQGIGGEAAHPGGALLRDAKGNLYGTTQNGGIYGYGTIFELDTTRKLTILYNFTGGADGWQPEAALTQDPEGNLYGTTYLGGNLNWGTVFMLAPNGALTVLHSFDANTDGIFPYGGLIRDPVGNLYGTASEAGPSGWGTVFKLTF